MVNAYGNESGPIVREWVDSVNQPASAGNIRQRRDTDGSIARLNQAEPSQETGILVLMRSDSGRMAPEPLVLFDIDGTLVRRAGPHHRAALVDAVRAITGLETSTDHIPVHGMLDPDILTQMMQDAGAAAGAIRRAMPEIIRLAQRLYLGSCPDLRRKTCPGARALLERLRGRGAVLGLVTGNLTAIGWKKLERAGLREYFQFGAFGEMAPNRAGLARLAIRKARRERLIARGAPVALIGDAPSDIIAAKASGARAIAVATGISTPDELLVHGPDLLLSDLRELRLSMLR